MEEKETERPRETEKYVHDARMMAKFQLSRRGVEKACPSFENKFWIDSGSRFNCPCVWRGVSTRVTMS